jgi:aromatic-L-amino-acid decarboxylase
VVIAEETSALIGTLDHVELCREPTLSIVLFRRHGWAPEDYLEWSHQLLRDQVALVTPSKWEGETVARFAFLNPNTTIEMVREILDSMR